MRSNRLVNASRSLLRTSVWVAGVLMVASAFSGQAFAVTPPPNPIPEIDPGSAASAMTLLMGGALLLTDRLRRRR